MTIDKTGRWWRGDEPADLHDYVRAYTDDGDPVAVIKDSICGACGGNVFSLRADRNEGAARRTCSACGAKEFIADSADSWPDATPRTCTCPCKNKTFNVAVGFSLRDTGDVRWVTIAQRCTACGVLGSYADWAINHSDTAELLDRA